MATSAEWIRSVIEVFVRRHKWRCANWLPHSRKEILEACLRTGQWNLLLVRYVSRLPARLPLLTADDRHQLLTSFTKTRIEFNDDWINVVCYNVTRLQMLNAYNRVRICRKSHKPMDTTYQRGTGKLVMVWGGVRSMFLIWIYFAHEQTIYRTLQKQKSTNEIQHLL